MNGFFFLVFFYSHSIFSQESVILNKKSTTNKTATSVQKNEKEEIKYNQKEDNH